MVRTALIDADVVAYRCAAKADYEGEDEEWAVASTLHLVSQWARDAGCDSILCCLSASRCFRYGLWPDYKKARASRPRPTWLDQCKQAIKANHRVVPHHDILEADDIMGILATNGKVPDPVIVTIDKDLRQVPGLHYNPDKGTLDEIGPEQAEEVFLYQWICGDPTDGYPGLPGVGPKKAQPLVEADDPYQTIIEEYGKRGLDREHAMTQARLARIVTAPLWNGREKEVIPWDITPTTFNP